MDRRCSDRWAVAGLQNQPRWVRLLLAVPALLVEWLRRRPVKAETAGSIPAGCAINPPGPLERQWPGYRTQAHMDEQPPLKRPVAGSNPARPTIPGSFNR